MNPNCVVCGRPVPDQAFACIDETGKARQQLAEIVELVGPARDVMHRQTSGDSTGSSGVPGSRVPIDLAAGERFNAVQNTLRGWAELIAESRSVGVVPDGREVIVLAAVYIAQSLEIARHKRWIDKMLREIADCLTTMRSVADRRRERIYLGVCGAPVPQPAEGVPDLPCCVATTCEPHGGDCCHHGNARSCPADPYVGDVPCEGSVYGAVGASKAVCKACGARHDQEARIAERAELARSHWYAASEIAEAYGIPASTIRSWRHRGLLTPRAEHDGHSLYAVADVLGLLATSKARAGQWRRETAEMGA